MDTDYICPISILLLAISEARQYKWIKNKNYKEDLGIKIIEEWFKNYFKSWYRNNWIEHLIGKKYHPEFDKNEFNIIKNQEDPTFVNNIINFLIENGNISENLGIILWASHCSIDINKVISFLQILKINDKRIVWNKEVLECLCVAIEEAERYKWIKSEKAGYDLGEEVVLEWFENYWENWIKNY